MQFRGYIDLGNHELICSDKNNLTADSKLLFKEANGQKNGNLLAFCENDGQAYRGADF
jgi:hypothetical protein